MQIQAHVLSGHLIWIYSLPGRLDRGPQSQGLEEQVFWEVTGKAGSRLNGTIYVGLQVRREDEGHSRSSQAVAASSGDCTVGCDCSDRYTAVGLFVRSVRTLVGPPDPQETVGGHPVMRVCLDQDYMVIVRCARC